MCGPDVGGWMCLTVTIMRLWRKWDKAISMGDEKYTDAKDVWWNVDGSLK